MKPKEMEKIQDINFPFSDPSKFFLAIQSLSSRLSVGGMLSYDSKPALIRLDGKKNWSRTLSHDALSSLKCIFYPLFSNFEKNNTFFRVSYAGCVLEKKPGAKYFLELQFPCLNSFVHP